MIPIIYDTNETSFSSNGLGRLRDCIEAKVVEERNGVYELDFQYPVDGANYDLIRIGRIVGVTHDDSDDIQPFDIVSYSRPIDGVVEFHCTHVSYRQSYLTTTGSNINSLADAFTLLGNAIPTNPFTYWTDKTSTGFMSAADGLPKSVRSLLGGIEGSILDAYGGEYEWDGFTVKLWSARGQLRNFSIRYGVNMLDYNEDYSIEGTYISCIPYWTDGENNVIGDKQTGTGQTVTARDECIPMDVSDKFDVSGDTLPTKAQVEAMGKSLLDSQNAELPVQNITVKFARLQDLGMEEYVNLMSCNLCDTINVVFPSNNGQGTFKIVKTVWDVLADRYEEMELGQLSVTLSQALGVGSNTTYVSGGGSPTPSEFLDFFYPVGSYYETSDDTFDPNVTWGGTWELDSQGKVTVAQDTTDTAFDVIGETGGNKDAIVPYHNHGFTGNALGNHSHTHTSGSHNFVGTVSGGTITRHTISSGSGAANMIRSTQPFYNDSATAGASAGTPSGTVGYAGTNGNATNANLQPYIVVKRWHRTA